MKRFAIAVMAAAAVSGCSQTDTVTTTAVIGQSSPKVVAASRMDLRGHAFAPPAFYDFCAKQPRLCSTKGSEKLVSLSGERMAQLRDVNLSVNRRIREQNDIEFVGKEDSWDLPTKVGDCEDFAILKKHELLKLGWPASALLLTVATSAGEGHVVLTVRTDQGDLVLDNRTNSIKDWRRTPYRYFARQSQSQHGKWDRIGGSAKPDSLI